MKYKLLFHFCALLLIATEVYRTFLLIPLQGSQEVPAVETSFFLYHYRWYIRIALALGMIVGVRKVFEKHKWLPILTLLVTGVVIYFTNFKMTAEAFFSQPETIAFAAPADAKIPMDAIVIGVTHNGESKAFPIRYLAYHHFVHDTVGGRAVLVTYCDVCRSGVVFAPELDGEPLRFRLVGMDQWNAMIEDRNTGSWFMQATGECIAGEHKGKSLTMIPSEQLSLDEWILRNPKGTVMLPVPGYESSYDDGTFEKGNATDALTRTDTSSWQDKSWVVGVELNNEYRAYDWNDLLRKRVIYDELGGVPVAVTIDSSNVNFRVYRFERAPQGDSDTLFIGLRAANRMTPIPARQTYWHTWKTFYPQTTKYEEPEQTY